MNPSSIADTSSYTPPFTSTMVINSIYDLFWLMGCILVAFAAVGLCIKLFNLFPASWYCDYNEKPSHKLYETRLYYRPTGVAISLLMVLDFIFLFYQYGAWDFYFYLNILLSLCLMMITVADYLYSIIPDQFTAAFLAVSALTAWYDYSAGHQIYNSEWWHPFAGALAGAGVMLCISLIGHILYKKAGVGFGDVKLFLAIGVLGGWPRILIIFFLSLVLACFHFLIMLILRKIKPDVYFPMGPYICISMMLYLAFQSQIQQAIDWYVHLIV